jgi:hypothetical protein
VKDGLVAKVHHWPGVNGLRALLEHRTIRVRRPRHFFREDGDLPEEIELTLGIRQDCLRTARRPTTRAPVFARSAAMRASTSATPRRTASRICSTSPSSGGGDEGSPSATSCSTSISHAHDVVVAAADVDVQ